MANSLFQSNQPIQPTQQIPQGVIQIKNMMDALSGAKNPQQIVQNLLGSNPQMQQVMQFANQFNGNYKSAFLNLAKSKGVDPQQIINFMKSK